MTKTGTIRGVAAAACLLAAGGCGGGDRGRITFMFSATGLAPLGPAGGFYEGWAVDEGGTTRSTGKFRVDASFVPPHLIGRNGFDHGPITGAVFGPANTDLGQDFPFIYEAVTFFVTLEAENDADDLPSGNVVIAGAFAGGAADLTVAGLSGSGGPGLADFSAAAGSAVLTTPTDGPGGDANGVWFTTDATGMTPSLSLPPLTGTSTYEAFVSEGAGFVSVGRFRDPASFDDDFQSHRGRGNAGVGFRAPGQDFVQGFTDSRPSPLDVADGMCRLEITAEPVQDNSVDAFPLVVLSTTIPTTAVNAAHLSAGDVALTNGAANLPAYAVAASGGVALAANGGVLKSLGAQRDGRYELFAVVGGAPASCGAFRVDALTAAVTSPDGMTNYGTSAAFVLNAANTGLGGAFPNVAAATEYFVTVEPDADPVPAPSDLVVLAGTATAGAATLTVAGAVATGGRGLADFSTASGTFIVRTPTDDAPGAAPNDQFGVWFRDFARDEPSLDLPALPAGWTYEAWIVAAATGVRSSMGRFRDPTVPDDDAMTWPGRGADNAGFRFPGQDFLFTVPLIVGTPLDLTTGRTVLVTVETTPDDSEAPSARVVLQGTAPGAPGTFPLANVFVGATGRVVF